MSLAAGCVELIPPVIEDLELSSVLTPSEAYASVSATDGNTVTFTWTNSNAATEYLLQIYQFSADKEMQPALGEITEEMLRYFIQKAIRYVPWRKRLLSPRVLVAVPSGITEVEKRAVKDSAKRAGAGEVVLIEEPMAAAVGVGLPVAEPAGSMIVDIGGGTTEVAVISLSGIVGAKSVRVGGDELDSAITQHLRKVYNLMIGELTAEEIKIRIGSAYPVKDDESLEVKGLDLVSRVPKTVRITAAEIRMALQEPVTTIIEAVRATLERCPPDLAADLIDRGIMLAGGGALLSGLDKLLTEETGLPVFVSEEPLNAVAKGTGVMLQEDSIWSS